MIKLQKVEYRPRKGWEVCEGCNHLNSYCGREEMPIGGYCHESQLDIFFPWLIRECPGHSETHDKVKLRRFARDYIPPSTK